MQHNQWQVKNIAGMALSKPSEDADNKDITQAEEKSNEQTPVWCSERCIQTSACILLTLGLSIIVISFYLALQQKRWQQFIPEVLDKHYDGGVDNIEIDLLSDVTDAYGTSETLLTYGPTENLLNANSNRSRVHAGLLFNVTSDDSWDKPPTLNDGFWDDDTSNDWMEAYSYGRGENDIGPLGADLSGCQEKLCKIACAKDGNLFSSLYIAMKTSTCTSIDIVLLESQVFPNDILKNSWLPTNRSVQEIVIRHSNLTKIRSNAFNSPMFVNTLLMAWRDLNIDKVESGALLGLFNLKYLTVDCNIRFIEPALFQPVQSTLTHLKLKANLILKGSRNPFGSTQMPNLEYLDLSNNFINGSLGRRMFISTPNLKYLHLVNSQLESIKSSAFAKIGTKLRFLNLSKNLLTTLVAETITMIVQHEARAMVNLSQNKWICNCNLREFSEMYKSFRNQFMDAVYCSAPHNLYGQSIDDVNYDIQRCKDIRITTVEGPLEVKEDEQTETTRDRTTKLYTNTPINDIDSNDLIDSGEITSGDLTYVLKMRCINEEPPVTTSTSTSTSASSSSSKSVEIKGRSSDDAMLKFPPPEHEFDLKLIAENNSVIVSVDKPSDLMIIWFSGQRESNSATFNDISVDYECVRYAQPHLIVGPLVENSTYTFCLIPRFQSSISPFNCLPLHVPLKRDENIWISQDKKQLTIGMLCLIFLVSSIVGALVAYYGIKTYPDLLEGSKNVLVVKRPEQTCYVTTISEAEYIKNLSLKKRKPSSTKQERCSTDSNSKKSSSKLPASENSAAADSHPMSLHTSLKNMESISSGISSATCFEDSFPENFLFSQDGYETPKVCENIYNLEQRMVQNNYGMSPTLPPPLPKRNSNTSDSPTVIINRFSRDT